MGFTDQVVAITGASSGIGHALAQEMARRGARVGLIARRMELLNELADSLRAAGATVAIATADVGNRPALFDAFAQLERTLGPVDLLVANAGVSRPTLLDPINMDEIETMVRVNLLGVIHSINAVLPGMLARGRGHLAAVSSVASYKGLPGESAYCATKAAVNTYLEGLRIQLRKKGIAVTTICPGFIRTPMTEPHHFRMPWLLEADEGARRIANALERRVKVFDFPWQMRLLLRVTRWLPDWIVAKTMQNYEEGRADAFP